MSANLAARASWEAGWGNILKQAFSSVPPIPSDITLLGQTAIITGASGGLGLESAQQLLQKRLSTLILAVRSQAKGDAAASKLRAAFPKADIRVKLLDMESYESVQDFASECEKLARLDIVILNAACGKMEFQRVEGGKGREITLQVNFLSTALLTILLIQILARKRAISSGPGRLTIVGSDMAHQAVLDESSTRIIDGIDREEGYSGMTQYGMTKLLILMFVAQLAEHVNPRAVIINIVNPGAVRGTDLLREASNQYVLRVIMYVSYRLLGRNVSDGARQYLHASLVMGKESHGSFVDFHLRPWSPIMYTEKGREVMKKLWLETLQELEISDIKLLLGSAAN